MYYFIINPNSCSGAANEVWKSLEMILNSKKIDHQAYFTRYPRDARKYTRRLTADGTQKTLVVVGGDGTLNEVVNGICDFDTVTLGFIPAGSSNDFARALGVPSDPKEALNTILTSRKRTFVDVGQITVDRHSRNFLISAGIGMDAAICHQASVSKLKYLLNQVKIGKLTYALLALQQLFLCRPARMIITVDGKTYNYDKVYLIGIMNVPYEGGGCMFAPNAKYNDDKLDLCVVEGLGKLKILLLLPTVFFGRHVRFNGIHIIRGRSIAIASRRPRIIHTDGETLNPKKVLTASCSGKRLRVIY